MNQRENIYRCNVCGNIVEMVHASKGQLVCCGQPMELLTEKTEDAGFEKHVPVVTEENSKANIKVGSIPHPMEPEHYIEWIELDVGDKIHRAFLKPGQAPETKFCMPKSPGARVREYCTVHGLWANNDLGK